MRSPCYNYRGDEISLISTVQANQQVIIFVLFSCITQSKTMYKIKIRKVGNSLGATIPKEVLEKLRVTEGDTVFVTETPDGVKLSAYNPEFERAMSIYKQGSHKYRNAMNELA